MKLIIYILGFLFEGLDWLKQKLIQLVKFIFRID